MSADTLLSIAVIQLLVAWVWFILGWSVCRAMRQRRARRMLQPPRQRQLPPVIRKA